MHNELQSFMTHRDLPEHVMQVDRRMIYRNNYFSALIDVLSARYPVVLKLVGDAFFKAVAKEYVFDHPPLNPVLAEYGEEFPAFLAQFPPAQSIPYLPDVALLESMRQQAILEEDAPVLDLALLIEDDPERLPQLSFRFLPSCRLFETSWPALEIWENNQQDQPAPMEIDEKAGGILVWRPELVTQMASLQPAEFVFFQLLMSGNNVETTCLHAMTDYPDLELAETIRKLALFDCLVGSEAEL